MKRIICTVIGVLLYLCAIPTSSAHARMDAVLRLFHSLREVHGDVSKSRGARSTELAHVVLGDRVPLKELISAAMSDLGFSESKEYLADLYVRDAHRLDDPIGPIDFYNKLRNIDRTSRRSEHRRSIREHKFEETRTTQDSMERQIARIELDRVGRKIMLLPEPQRQIVAYINNGLTHKDIKIRLGISEANSRTILNRARVQLRREMPNRDKIVKVLSSSDYPLIDKWKLLNSLKLEINEEDYELFKCIIDESTQN